MNERFAVFRFLVAASGEYAWSSLKNCVKVLTGRNRHFDERGLFLRQYVLHLTGLRRIRTITCVRRSGREGAGSQAHMIMNAINFARISGLTYLHTPFMTIHHADRPMEEWVRGWETLFNLGAGEVACDARRHEVVNYCYNWDALELCFGWRDRREHTTHCFKALIPEFRRKYYLNKSPREADGVTVALHVRRGDVSGSQDGNFTSTEAIVKTIITVKAILEAQPVNYRVRVYSQGSIADFPELSPLGLEFFLDADAIWTMRELIEADILIMAKGFFSYYAGLISDGIKIFEPRAISLSSKRFLPSWAWMYLSPADDWLPCRADGSLDRAAFERQLSLLMRAKAALGPARPQEPPIPAAESSAIAGNLDRNPRS